MLKKGEILAAAKIKQAERDEAESRTGFYEIAIALLQIAIVLATASLIVHNRALIFISVTFTTIATFSALNGYVQFI